MHGLAGLWCFSDYFCWHWFNNSYFLIAGEGVSKAAEEGSSGIWILRLGLR